MTIPQHPPIVLISPEARAKLAAEANRAGVIGGLAGGLLFGYPVDVNQRLVISSIRLSEDVGFGRRDFSLDQTRTSRDLDHARSLDPKATYGGTWYLHRTPNQELSDDEWVQTQTLLEDPDFRLQDLVCLVLCSYGGELEIYASSFNRHHSARGQAPVPTEMRLTTDWLETEAEAPHTAPSMPAADWYRSPEVAARLDQERQRLAERYQVEPALAPDKQMFFRLSPARKYEKLSFYLATGPGFPKRAPHVFLLVAGKPYRISTPSLGSWSADQWLVELADEIVQWLAFSIDEYITRAKEALKRGSHREAADLLTVVLSIEPRTTGAARLLAKTQAQ